MKKPFPHSTISVCHDIWPGDIGYITYMHAVLYAPEQGWDYTFDIYVALPLAEFAQSQSPQERIWILKDGDRIAGSMAIVRHSQKEAQLRGLLLEPEIRGRGIGKWLVESINRRDYPVLQCFTLLMTLVFVLCNLGIDVLYAWLDPRIRLASREETAS